MIEIIRTNSKNIHFVNLVKQLDTYLKIKDGDDHDFYNQYNNIDVLNHVVIAFLNKKPVACGAFKEFDSTTVEIKRMFTSPESRGNGLASKILRELETWSSELSYNACILETGKRQTEAVAFYKKMSYKLVPNYGQYKNMDNSLCFKKVINTHT